VRGLVIVLLAATVAGCGSAKPYKVSKQRPTESAIRSIVLVYLIDPRGGKPVFVRAVEARLGGLSSKRPVFHRGRPYPND
jgi:hypothetical protein